MIRVRDLEFQYDKSDFRLRVANLQIADRERVAIVGPSGSGKTTLLNLFAGIATPHRGSVETAGQDVSSMSDRARRQFRVRHVGLVFQEFELLEYLTVLDNVLLPYFLTPALKLDDDVRARAVRLAEGVEIDDKLGRNVARLSQGERQRVALCRALLTDPSVILADEPTGNLDPSSKMRVVDLLLERAQEANATLVAVTHDHEVAERFDRVLDMGTLQ